MKKKMKRLFAFLLASMMMFSTLSLTASADEDGYLMYLGYGGNSDWGFQYNAPDAADNAGDIVATTATVKPGDTVTIGLEFPSAPDCTWWMAPVLVAENVSNVDYTINSIMIDGTDVLADVDLAAGDAWWYEGTGTYSSEQSIRLAGGYNEWGTKYMAAGPAGFTKIEYNITVNAIDAAAASAGTTVASDATFDMFLGYGGNNDWSLCYNSPINEDNNADIVATTAQVKAGETATIGLEFPTAPDCTWWMAPVLVANTPDVSNVDYTINSILIDGVDVLADVDLAAGDAWWYEGTGAYTAEQTVRLAGGYNEWGTKYMAAGPSGFTKIEYSITLNAVEITTGGAGATESTESYPAFIAIGADKTEGDWYYSYDGGNVPDGMTITSGELKSGETTTLAINFDEPVFKTWYVAPCFITPDSSLIAKESTFDVKVYLDGAEVTPDFAAGDAFWAEGTGSYPAEQAVRIAGGYNEWGTQYIAAPAGFKEIKYEITPTIMIAAAEEAPQNEFDPNGTYHAYLGIQTANYAFRNAFDDANYGLDAIGAEKFDQISFVDGTDLVSMGGDFTDVEITGNGTYTVKVEGFDFNGKTPTDLPMMGDDGSFNLLFVATDLPVNDAVVISNVTLKIDGKEIVTKDTAFLDGDSKEIQKVLLANIWNKEIEALPYYPIPANSVEITFDVNGFANDAVVAEPEATPAPEATEAPAPEATEAPAADPTAAPAADPTAAPAATTPAEKSSNTGLIIGIVAAVAVVAVGAGVVVAKKKKK
ncbi:MAG: hypothetical protein IJN16_00720 [Lachnospiraceae bacterium]|nr:hypothetical protein [Lachnospiraceae bacterium]